MPWPDQNFTRMSYPTPYNHEATQAVSNTALALSVTKWGGIRESSGSAQVTGWTLKGVNRNNSDSKSNTNALTLFWTLTDSGGTRTVKLYKNSSKAANQEVASGSKAGDGEITLTASNASGITGTVTVTYTANDTGLENQLIICPRACYAKVSVDTQPIRWWADNTVPTAEDGMYAVAGDVVELTTSEEIMNFRMIRQGGSDANVSVMYYE